MDIHKKHILTSIGFILPFIFDFSTVLLISSLYLFFRYRQFTMFIKLWFICIYKMFGVIGLLFETLGAVLVLCVIYKSFFMKCIEHLPSLPPLPPLPDFAFFDPYLAKIDKYLEACYKFIYMMFSFFAPTYAEYFKNKIIRIGNIIASEDTHLMPAVKEPSPPTQSLPSGQTRESILAEIGNVMNQINGLLGK